MDERGHIVVIDRAKDVGQLSDGSAYAPQFIENKLKFSPYISEVVSFGDKRPFICAMVAIDLNTVGNWAERQALAYTNYMDLSQKPETYELVRSEIERINRGLPEAGRVKRFLLLGKDLDADDAEITRTRKLRRSFIADKYADVIEAFYSGGTLRRAAHRRHLRGRAGGVHRQSHANPRRGLRGAHLPWQTSIGASSWSCWSPAS